MNPKKVKPDAKLARADHRTARGPEPERLKITGVKNWEDAVGVAMRKPKPSGGWPK
jgi:hypothetical protein